MDIRGVDEADLVTRRLRRAFRELAPKIVLREIDGLWQDEGFAKGESNDLDGERRSLFQSYLDAVDWTDPGQVRRALRVFHETARKVGQAAAGEAIQLLQGEGIRFDARGEPQGWFGVRVRVGLLDNLNNPDVIREHLRRIERALADQDASQAIGSAKELVESTAKLVLRSRNVEPGRSDDLPKLVKDAQFCLGVHSSSPSSAADGQQSTKRILGGLSAVVVGLGELRNAGYGTGHGHSEARVGLYPRHAHLAVSAARAWCEFMLDTLQDAGAPWRNQDGS